ncbi:MAG: precorrin-3B C(17)-methyltransferase, partial [Bacteroidaceae bacterium]|nr:precorrin-3B C(17)-methyltransferase [Bacteroidaceae bacterium]
MKITVVGIGPGSPEDITPAVAQALSQCDVVVGYKYYFRFLAPFLSDGTQCVDSGMRREQERAEEAFRLAEEGRSV